MPRLNKVYTGKMNIELKSPLFENYDEQLNRIIDFFKSERKKEIESGEFIYAILGISIIEREGLKPLLYGIMDKVRQVDYQDCYSEGKEYVHEIPHPVIERVFFAINFENERVVFLDRYPKISPSQFTKMFSKIVKGAIDINVYIVIDTPKESIYEFFSLYKVSHIKIEMYSPNPELEDVFDELAGGMNTKQNTLIFDAKEDERLEPQVDTLPRKAIDYASEGHGHVSATGTEPTTGHIRKISTKKKLITHSIEIAEQDVKYFFEQVKEFIENGNE